jgi:ankyrin repeat protein
MQSYLASWSRSFLDMWMAPPASDAPALTVAAAGLSLEEAADDNNREYIAMRLREGWNVNATGTHGHTALHRASERSHEALLDMLLAAGADVNVTNDAGDTPIVLAAWWGEPSITRKLLDAGACVNSFTGSGNPVLIDASWSGREDIIPMLLRAGTDVHLTNDAKETALHMAVSGVSPSAYSAWHENIIVALLASGAPVDDQAVLRLL